MAEKEEKPSEEIRLSRTEIKVPTVTGEPATMLYITYTTKDLPPGLIKMPKDEWTAAKEIELIRADIKKRRETKPATIRL